MAMSNEQLTKWIDEIFGTIDEIKQNSGDISGLTKSVRQLREDLTATQEDVDDLEDQTAGTVSLPKAALQHFTDGSATQALDLVADIIPVQAGTGDPSPTNVRAITGYSSVIVNTHAANYLNAATITSGAYLDSEGHVRIVGGSDWSYSDYISLVAGESYTLSGVENMGSTAKHCFYDAAKNLISSINTTEYTFTAPNNCKYVRLSLRATTYNGIILSSGEAPTTYEPYTANTATLSLGRTIYGGSADFTTGAETETLVAEDIGTSANITWEDAAALHAQGVFPFTISGADYATQSWMAEKYKIVYGNDWTVENGQIKVTVTAGGSVGCRLCDTNYTSLEALKTALTGSKLIHPITTQNTYTTTPAQLSLMQGENNVSATSGPITLTYAPDNVLAEVYAYIQKRFDTLAASLTANSTTRKTTKNTDQKGGLTNGRHKTNLLNS